LSREERYRKDKGEEKADVVCIIISLLDFPPTKENIWLKKETGEYTTKKAPNSRF
jgi:hypothetical protein